MVRVFAPLLFVLLLAPAASASVLLDPPMVPPTPPMNVAVTEDSSGVTITWDPPLFDGGASSVTYRVYKDSSLIADQLASTSYTDQLPPGESAATSTNYYVTAVNDAGESAQAGGSCVTVEGPAVDPTACIDVAWALIWWVVDQVL